MKTYMALLSVCLLTALGRAEKPDALIQHQYPVMPQVFAHLWDDHVPTDYVLDVHDYFQKFGVKWPEGSVAAYNIRRSILTVVNTRANHERLEQQLATIDVVPQTVRLTVEVLDSVGASSPLPVHGAAFGEPEARMRREGTIRTLMKLSAIGDAGTVALISSVMDSPSGQTNAVTRYGRLQILPVVAPDGYTISVSLRGMLVIPDSPDGANGRHEIQTRFTIWDGQVVRMSLDEQGAQKQKPSDPSPSSRYLRIHAELLDPAGRPISQTRDLSLGPAAPDDAAPDATEGRDAPAGGRGELH